MVSPADADAEAATRREDVAVGGEGGDPGAAAAAAARANADPGRKKVLRVRTFKNKMQIILNLSNIDTLPDVFIYPEAAVSLAVLILALSIASESTAELEEAVRRETGVETNVMPILKPSGLLLNNYDIQFTYRLTEQGYFFIILLTMFALFFSDRPQFMVKQYNCPPKCSFLFKVLVLFLANAVRHLRGHPVPHCRALQAHRDAAADKVHIHLKNIFPFTKNILIPCSPPTLNVGLDDTNSTSRLFRGVRYVPVSIPRQGGGGDVSRISLEGADPCGPSFEQLQAQVRRTEDDFSKLKLEMHSNLVRVRKFAFLSRKLEVRSSKKSLRTLFWVIFCPKI